MLTGPQAAKPLRILIIGGTSGIGLETVKLALARGHSVSVMARHAPAAPIKNEHLKYLHADVTDAVGVSAAVAGQDAVVTTISVAPTRGPVSVFSTGARNVLDAMTAADVRRLIAVTGIGAGESRGHGGFGYDRIFQPLLLGTIYEDKDREEAAIRASAVDWTIVRPGRLTDERAEHHYWVVGNVDRVTGGSISRADVAHFIVAAIESGQDARAAVMLTN
jgi:putative NADH-flavin reductase